MWVSSFFYILLCSFGCGSINKTTIKSVGAYTKTNNGIVSLSGLTAGCRIKTMPPTPPPPPSPSPPPLMYCTQECTQKCVPM